MRLLPLVAAATAAFLVVACSSPTPPRGVTVVIEQLFSSGSTRLIKGFKGKKGVPFDATVIFDESFNLKLSFPKSKGGKGK